eukprot:354895-Chlamydomonas_euryale.AAC.7
MTCVPTQDATWVFYSPRRRQAGDHFPEGPPAHTRHGHTCWCDAPLEGASQVATDDSRMGVDTAAIANAWQTPTCFLQAEAKDFRPAPERKGCPYRCRSPKAFRKHLLGSTLRHSHIRRLCTELLPCPHRRADAERDAAASAGGRCRGGTGFPLDSFRAAPAAATPAAAVGHGRAVPGPRAGYHRGSGRHVRAGMARRDGGATREHGCHQAAAWRGVGTALRADPWHASCMARVAACMLLSPGQCGASHRLGWVGV